MGYEAALSNYTPFEFDNGRWTRTVYRRGTGPAVIVIHEMPGLHPLVIRFADRVAAAGMTVFLPSLFGTPGKPVTIGYARSYTPTRSGQHDHPRVALSARVVQHRKVKPGRYLATPRKRDRARSGRHPVERDAAHAPPRHVEQPE